MNVAQAFQATQEPEFLETLRIAARKLADAMDGLCAVLPADESRDKADLLRTTIDRAVRIDGGDPMAPVVEAVKLLLRAAAEHTKDASCSAETRSEIKRRSTLLSQATKATAQNCASLIDGAAQGTIRPVAPFRANVAELLAAAVDVAKLFHADHSEPVRLALIVRLSYTFLLSLMVVCNC